MLQEQGQVVTVEAGAVWVETRRKSTCSSCSARAGCGHALLEKLQNNRQCAYIRARCDLEAAAGDQVVIGIPEQAVVQGSLLVYLWPLLALMAGIWLGYGLGWPEPVMALSGLLAMAGAFALACRWSRRSAVRAELEAEVLELYPARQVVRVQ